MEASPAWVDDVIVIFPQDGNPVSWSMEMMKLVTYFVNCCNLLSSEVAERCQWPAASCIQSCWRGLEWRQAAKWGSEHVENRMCLMSGSARWECSLMIPSPEDISGGKTVSELTTAGWWKELLQHPGMKRRTDLCCALKVFLEKKENVMQMNWWTAEEFHGRGLGRGSVNDRVHQFWH